MNRWDAAVIAALALMIGPSLVLIAGAWPRDKPEPTGSELICGKRPYFLDFAFGLKPAEPTAQADQSGSHNYAAIQTRRQKENDGTSFSVSPGKATHLRAKPSVNQSIIYFRTDAQLKNARVYF